MALVVTIIVILILAGITLVTVFGDNGLVTMAIETSFREEMAEIKEQAAARHLLAAAAGYPAAVPLAAAARAAEAVFPAAPEAAAAAAPVSPARAY